MKNYVRLVVDICWKDGRIFSKTCWFNPAGEYKGNITIGGFYTPYTRDVNQYFKIGDTIELYIKDNNYNLLYLDLNRYIKD